MYNGRIGGKMKTTIFIGPTYYQWFIHMAEDKIKYWNHGPVHPLNRQPVADKKLHGGVKFRESWSIAKRTTVQQDKDA